ncbi:MAG: (2Fe-2S)-binding protein [Mycobacterium sp.]
MDTADTTPGQPITAVDGTEILTRIARLGDYFTLDTDTGEEWQPVANLLDHGYLAESVDRTRAAIAQWAGCEPQKIPLRVASSSFQLGIASRLLSPTIGAASTFAAVPLLTADSVRWTTTASHSPRFGVAVCGWSTTPTTVSAAAAISASLIHEILQPLNEALRSVTALSRKVMWGNVMSAANGAVTVMALSQPQYESRGRELVRALMETENLSGTARFEHNKFVRRSCCLFYLAPNSGLCGDCVLAE